MRVVLWMLAGLVLGAELVVLVAGVIVPWLTPVSQREGAYAMGVIFVMAPAGAVAGAVIGLVLGLTRRQSGRAGVGRSGGGGAPSGPGDQ